MKTSKVLFIKNTRYKILRAYIFYYFFTLTLFRECCHQKVKNDYLKLLNIFVVKHSIKNFNMFYIYYGSFFIVGL